ncbi:TonB-dependent receptor [Paraflavitalea sp. CAU 1676]|uniref:SusC/RagA family TonB-linked outer membrane protein n=1 Tax=Paraflavitalea sp. CAU 1676 TaxID=3032598 RepID=UPI0023DACF00|nr:TonB-dependent receptor [Paraflavitalea sp. CAU 1676]MDF2193484.1 TonB-dependent receptor [Paraflavitalea sp. CAU 1676]
MKQRMLACLLLFCSFAMAQNKTITGQVFDAKTNVPLAGANILATGSTGGTATDNNGRFSLQVPAATTTIQVSMTNYLGQTIALNNQTNLSIALVMVAKDLDQVVVVGYGTQKKKDLTGAVSTVSAKDIGGRQTVQVSEALSGSIAGVSVTRSSAEPGAGSSILIRGITTIGTNSPLVIVDGIPVSSIDLVNPNDIESLSVLKDAASAAIYGSRGAAGVILVTTKRGKSGQSSLEYNYEYGIQRATAQPQYAGVQDYFRYFNEQAINDGASSPVRTDAFINSYLDSNRANPDKFPNTDWQKAVFTNPNAPRVRHDLVFTSGTDKLRTKASFGYSKVGALYDNFDYQRYQFRVNNDLQISKILSANLDVAYRRTNNNSPVYNPIFDSRIYPAFYDDFYDDGRYAPGKDGANPISQLREGGTKADKYNQLAGRIGLQLKPLPGLQISAMVAPVFDWNKTKTFNKQLKYYDKADPARVIAVNATPKTTLNERREENFAINGQFLVSYIKNIGAAHHFDLLAGYEENYASNETVNGQRTGFPLTNYPYLNTGSTEIMESYGNASEFGLHSFFGRLQYNYQNKYYIQGNLRYDESSRFAKEYRGATFPSISLGWTLSEESFLKGIDWLSFLKLRGSWGEAGNERIGNYPYQSTLDFSSALFYQNNAVTPLPGLGQQVYAVPNISWETTRTGNIGIDAALLNNRLSVTAEYYEKRTTDILLPLDIPLFLGYEKPNQNAGTLDVKGWELELAWKDRIGKISYTIAANLSDARSKIGDLKGTQYLGDQVIRQGSEYNEWFGYLSNGIFQNQAELNGAPVLNANTKPGDIRFIDITKDGKITPDDKVLLGGALPRYLYGGNIRVEYAGFDFSTAFQGVGKKLSRRNGESIRPFLAAFGNVPANMVGKFWSRNNTEAQNLQASYPRLSVTAAGSNYSLSDFWLMNGAYFRLKNITVGYTLKPELLKKAGVQTLRFYVSANDVFSLSKFPRYIDPEAGDLSYPIVKTLLAGATIRF